MDTSNSPPKDARYRLDFSSHSCRIRIDGAKPGKEVKVLVKDLQQADAPVLHGLGVRSDKPWCVNGTACAPRLPLTRVTTDRP